MRPTQPDDTFTGHFRSGKPDEPFGAEHALRSRQIPAEIARYRGTRLVEIVRGFSHEPG